MNSREHLIASGYGGGWQGYRAHARHAWGRTGQLLRIVWWSAVHALVPGAYPFRARHAVLDLATEVMSDRLSRKSLRYWHDHAGMILEVRPRPPGPPPEPPRSQGEVA